MSRQESGQESRERVANVCGHRTTGAIRRGLCTRDYEMARRNDMLEMFPVKQNNPFDVADEVEHAGITFVTAHRLNLKPMGLVRALERAGRRDLITKLGGEYRARTFG